MERHGYDVFFSYAWEDITQATEIVAAMRRLGLAVFQDFSRLKDYDDIAEEIESALYQSRALVALYTPDFMPSPYCRWELYTALVRGYRLDRKRPRVLPLVRGMAFEEVRPRALTSLRLPERGAQVADLARSVQAKIAELDNRRFGDAPTAPEAPWYPFAPPATREFHGRLEELWDVRDALLAGDDADLPSPAVARITGLGGLGKTTLAERYALTFAADHPGGVFVLRGFGSHRRTQGNPALLTTLRNDQVADIAARLGIDTPGRSPEWVDGALRRHLESVGLPYLWIVDDLPAGIDEQTCATLLAPTSMGRTLITTRGNAHYRWGEQVELHGLDRAAAFRLLTSRRAPASHQDRAAARALSDDLGGHPLGLIVAAGLAAQPEFAGYSNLRAAVSSPGPGGLELGEELSAELPGDHRAGVAATLLRSITKVTPAARQVLRLASLLAPAPIPEPLFTEVLAHASGHDAATIAAGLADAQGRSLATPQAPGPGTTGEPVPHWSVHALVSRAIRAADSDDGWQADIRTAAIMALTSVLESTRLGQAQPWLAPYLPHVRALAGAASGEDYWHVLNEAARAHVELGDSKTAAEIFAALYESARTALGPTDVTTLTVQAGLGAAYGLQGQFERALSYKQLAYHGLRERLGGDHPDVLIALNNVAVAYSDAGDHHAARAVYAKVYRSRRRLFQAQHPETIAALANVAIAAEEEGNLLLAQRLKQVVYQRCVAVRGTGHPATLDALNSIGVSQHRRGDSAAAHRTFTEVLRKRAGTLGPDHPDTLTALANVAMTSGDDDHIRTVLSRVYLDRTAIQGPAHPEVLRTLFALLTSHARLTDASATTSVNGDVDSNGPASLPSPEMIFESAGTPRLDNPMTDFRIQTFELAYLVHETAVHRLGESHKESLWLLCLLAHATAALGQFDQQYDNALALIEDALDGLTDSLSAHHESTRFARQLREWIEELADSSTSPPPHWPG
jgi:tetratricopeptide (TPR) repeat protein